jgi:quercetin dioxygenase-like cupin family protein
MDVCVYCYFNIAWGRCDVLLCTSYCSRKEKDLSKNSKKIQYSSFLVRYDKDIKLKEVFKVNEEAVVNKILKGTVYALKKDTAIEELPWNPHPSFKGVALMHLVTGQDTNGQFSAHVVHVQAGCEIGAHIHEGKWEMHEVISGRGKCMLRDKCLNYQIGSAAILPPDVTHQVKAAEEDLYILAKFVPALL